MALITTLRAFPDRIKAWIPRPVSKWSRLGFRLAFGLAGVFLLGLALLLTLLRFFLLPQINDYRSDFERAFSAELKLPVSIGHVEGRMQGFRPRLELHGLEVKDADGRPALSFDNVAGVVAWSSLLHDSLRFYLLEVNAPVLAVRRDPEGHLFVAGLAVKSERSKPDVSAWVLTQREVVIRDARVTWTDELRRAPPLSLDHLNLRLRRTVVGGHRLGLTAQPPSVLAARIDLRAEFSGDSINEVDQWHGKLYGEVDQADLSGGHPWFDYPVELPRGRGGARVWLDFTGLRPTAATADLSLANVQVRLAPDLAMLSLRQLNGRASVEKTPGGFKLSTRQLSLDTADGMKVAPLDLMVERDGSGGQFTVNTLDFRALATLAAHLPLPAEFRQQLAAYSPRGSLEQFQMQWHDARWPPPPMSHYSIKGTFRNLAFASVDKEPGFSGMSGSVDGDQDGGSMQVSGRKGAFTLPAVFLQPVSFDSLDGQLRWKKQDQHTEIDLSNVKFHNADVEGSASGSYQLQNNGIGSIDLDATLTRADGAAIWRYMPLQAGPDVGPYLRQGLSRGKVTTATLKLKGNLDKFPFADRSGIFRIHGDYEDATLRYAEGWPEIEGVAGAIDFDGPAMTISARQARILGVSINPATARIPDLVTMDEQLLVEGKAVGATTNFLKFIEASPIGEQINHFTRDMAASGNGELNLKLTLPLRRLDQSVVNGSYRIDGNRLLLDPDTPPFDNVRGHLEFSGESLNATGMTATVFGLPLKVNLKTQKDGSVLADAFGDASAAQLRKQFPYAGLKNLGGSARWKATVRAKKPSADIRISSDLVGLSSSLPEPFNKSAREPMPLLFEQKATDIRLPGKRTKDAAVREMTELSLGRVLHAQLIYRQDAGHSSFERGLVTLGDATMRLPDRGLALAVSQPRIDADVWLTLLQEDDDTSAAAKPVAGKAADASPAASSLMPNRIDLNTPELQLGGRTVHDLKVSATRPDSTWLADISSREVVAKLQWKGGDDPKLSGRITRFAPPLAPSSSPVSADTLKSMPDLDLTFDDLILKGNDYGQVHFSAENEGNDWNASFSVKNPDGTLDGKGRWRPSAAPQPAGTSDTQLEFTVQAKSVERFLNRTGYPNTVRGGTASLNGNLAWRGSPLAFDLATLGGRLNLEARDGQFNKLDPGAAGRLLGVLSLQEIPRRINLDFHDVFSDGFAFDTIKGQMAISKGVMNTENMVINGPAAKVQMAGNVDLVKETQDLKVRVQPAVSGSVATGVFLLNPVVGATAWAFNKIFGSPLDAAFAYDYLVKGSWTEPQVTKVGAQAPAAAKAGAGQ